MKIKITAKFPASRHLRFEDTKRIMSPEIRPKSFGTFEKQAPDWLNKSRCYNLVHLVSYQLLVALKKNSIGIQFQVSNYCYQKRLNFIRFISECEK